MRVERDGDLRWLVIERAARAAASGGRFLTDTGFTVRSTTAGWHHRDRLGLRTAPRFRKLAAPGAGGRAGDRVG